MQTIRIFISSPGDVAEERQIAGKVLERLQGKYWSFVRLDDVFWENKAVRATAHYQDELIDPGECEMVVGILWSRLGSPLPEKFANLPGKVPTGTEWELEQAFNAYAKSLEDSDDPQEAKPDILIYRRLPAPIGLAGKEAIQLGKLETYFRENFFHHDGTIRRPILTYKHLEEFEQKFTLHVEELILRAIPKLQPGYEPPPISGNPFKGLAAFEFEDADRFFGRNRQIREVQQRLRERAQVGTAFVLIYGASGYGKSSLMKAGLAPTICRPGGALDGMDCWRRVLLQPSQGTGPLCERLARTLMTGPTPEELDLARLKANYPSRGIPELRQSSLSTGHGTWDEANLARSLANDEEHALAIAAVADTLAEKGVHLLLMVDQLEEVFNEGVTEDEREAFFRVLHGFARSRRIWVVATMRSEYFPRIAAVPELRRLVGKEGGYILPPPDLQSLSEIIRFPVLAARLGYERATELRNIGGELAREEWLHDQILADTRENTDALPLLEFCLERLYERRRDNLLTWDAYEAMGGLPGSIATTATEVYGRLDEAAKGARDLIFGNLVRVGETVTRRRADLRELEARPGAEAFLQAFREAKLLVTDEEAGNPTVTLAHESLLTHWPLLAQWIDLHRADLAAHHRLIDQASLWDQNGRSKRYLLSEGRLAEAERVAGSQFLLLNEAQRTLLDLSRQVARRRLRILQGAVAVFALLTVVAAGAAAWAWKREQDAKNARLSAENAREEAELKRQEAAHALGSIYLKAAESAESDDRLLMAAKALGQAHRSKNSGDQYSGSSLSPELLKDPSVERDQAGLILSSSTSFPRWGTGASPIHHAHSVLSGLTGILTNGTNVWNMRTRNPVERRISAEWLDLSPDGRLGVRVGRDGIEVVEISTGEILLITNIIARQAGSESLVRFSNNSRVLAIKAQHAGWGISEPLKIWNLDTHAMSFITLSMPDRSVNAQAEKTRFHSLAISNDGDAVAALTDKHMLCIWDGNLNGNPHFASFPDVSGDEVHFAPGAPEMWISSNGNSPVRRFGYREDEIRDLGLVAARGRVLFPGGESRPALVFEPSRGISTWSRDLAEEQQVIAESRLTRTFSSVGTARDGSALVLENPVDGNSSELRIIGTSGEGTVVQWTDARFSSIDKRMFSRCGRYLLRETGTAMFVVDSISGKVLADLPLPDNGWAWSDDGMGIYLVHGDSVCRYRTSDWTLETKLPKRASGELMACSDPRQALVFAGERGIEILDLDAGAIKTLPSVSPNCTRLEFDFSGRYLAVLSKNEGTSHLHVIDLDQGGKKVISESAGDFVFLEEMGAIACASARLLTIRALPDGRLSRTVQLTQEPGANPDEEPGGKPDVEEPPELLRYGFGVLLKRNNEVATYQFEKGLSEWLPGWDTSEVDDSALSPSLRRLLVRGIYPDNIKGYSLAIDGKLPRASDLSAFFEMLDGKHEADSAGIPVPEDWHPYQVSNLGIVSPDGYLRIQDSVFLGSGFLYVTPVMGGTSVCLEYGNQFGSCWNAIWAPSGNRIGLQDDHLVGIWDGRSGKLIRFLETNGREFIGFLGDGTHAAFLAQGRHIEVVRIADGIEAKSGNPNEAMVSSKVIVSEFSIGESGNLLAVVTNEGFLEVFMWNSGDLTRLSRVSTGIKSYRVKQIHVNDARGLVVVSSEDELIYWSKEDGVRRFDYGLGSYVFETTREAKADRVKVPDEVMSIVGGRSRSRNAPLWSDPSKAVEMLEPWASRIDLRNAVSIPGRIEYPLLPLDGFPPIIGEPEERELQAEAEGLAGLNPRAALAAWSWMGPRHRRSTADAICTRLLALASRESAPGYARAFWARTARRIADDVISIDPANLQASLNAGSACILIDETDKAYRYYTTMLDCPEAGPNELIGVLSTLQVSKESTSMMSRILEGPGKRFANSPLITEFLGWAHISGDLQLSIEAFQSAKAAYSKLRNPPIGVLIGLSLALQLSGDEQGAINIYKEMMKIKYYQMFSTERIKARFPTAWFPVIDELEMVRVKALSQRNQDED